MRSIVSASAWIFFRDARDQADRVWKIGRLRGHHEGRVDLNRHRQFAAGAVVDDATLGGEIKTALLLMLGSALEIAVTKNLQIDEAKADGQEPKTQKSGKSIKPEPCAARLIDCCHFRSLENRKLRRLW